MKTYHLVVVSPLKVIFEGEVISTVIPGSEGFFEVLANHMPIVASLKAGKLVIKQSEGTTTFPITGGFFEFSRNQGTLLADGLAEQM